jgi:hypothetical protein
MRALYLTGFAYVAYCLLLLRAAPREPSASVGHPEYGAPAPVPAPASDGAHWFAAIKPHCSALE